MSNRFDFFTSWIATRRWITAIIIFLISCGAIVGHVDPHSVTRLFKSSQSSEQENNDEFAADEPDEGLSNVGDGKSVEQVNFLSDAILVIETEAAFTPRGAAALRHIAKELRNEDYVKSVQWMDEIPTMNIFGLPEPLLPNERASQKKFDAARQKALKNPFIKGVMMSDDMKTLIFLVNYDRVFLDSDEQAISGVQAVAVEAAKEYADVPMQFSVTGRTPIWLTATQTHNSNQFMFQAIGYGMIALMSLILFRGFMSVLIVSLAPLMGVFWTVGYVKFFGYENNPFMEVILPILVSLVGLTDGVHLMVTTRRLRAMGMSTIDASRQALSQVGLACALTSLTTAIGFGSLILADHRYIQQFGISCVVGVVLCFIAVVTVIPLACSSWMGKNIHVGIEKSLIAQNLDRISDLIQWVLRRKNWLSHVAIVSTIALVAISLTLRPDEKLSNSIPASSPAAIAFKKLDKAMKGLERSQILVQWKGDADTDSTPRSGGGLSDHVAVIKEADRLLQNEPLVGFPLSIVQLIDSMPGTGETVDRSSLLELVPPALKQAFYRPFDNNAEIVFRVQDLGISKYGPVFKRIEDGLSEIQKRHPGYTLTLTGDAVWRWRNLYQIVVDLAVSLGTASLIIFVVLSLVYRSLRIGLISLVPNLFPLAVAGGYLVISGQSLEIVTVCAFTVCLGIAVDDTIHFLTRYEEELTACGDRNQAINHAFSSVGTALIMTTVVLVTGFSAVLLSDSRDHYMFASMGAITISSALFADLIFLPALLSRYGSRSGN